MSSRTYISDDALAKLADKFGIEQKHRPEFKKAMSWAAFKYAMTKNIPLDIGKIKAGTKELERAAQALINGIDRLEKALQYFDGLSENPTVQRKRISLSRDRVQEQDVAQSRKLVRADVTELYEIACEENDKFNRMGRLKKHIGNPSFNWLLETLIDAFEAGGKELDRQSGAKPAEWYDELQQFIKCCFPLLGVETKKSDSALCSAINNAINRKEKSKKID